MKLSKFLSLAAISLVLAGCAQPNSQVLAGDSQVQLRSMQTKAFDTADKNSVIRSVISTLQDLNFIIDQADDQLGTVSATKLSGYQIKMTVTVRPKSAEEMLVRASAQYNLDPITDPKMYQDFFSSLSKSLFLTANSVE